ncbi:hypothetical protein Q8F55_008962 [Vanrija albida]|uniref:Uncharacterized protein n=1 Tax=Vanrija albida TaxID=181172 RepID=A0ABR3PT83_9TREE
MSSSSANWRFTVASIDSEPDASSSSRPSTSTPTDASPPSTWGRLRSLGGRITRSRADLRGAFREAAPAPAPMPMPASPAPSHYSPSPSIDFTADPFAASLGPNAYEHTYGFSYSCDPRLSPLQPQPPTPTRATFPTFPQQPALRGHARSESKSSTFSSSSTSSVSNSSRVSQVAAFGFKRSEASWALRHPRTNGDVRASAELLAHIQHLGTSFTGAARRGCKLCREEEEEDIERARDAFLRTR